MSQEIIQKAVELYGMDKWGEGFFDVNEQGNLTVTPLEGQHHIDLKVLADEIQNRGLELPVLVRFSNILQQRILTICKAFQSASESYGYHGKYYGVYPVKVNPHRQVVKDVIKFGNPYHFGVEAGSKPELYATLAMMESPNAPIICNGYKDETYIRMALIGQKLNRTIFIVVEKLHELNLIIKQAKTLNIKPRIGLRVRLSSSAIGRWGKSGGDFSKFGLTVAEVMNAVNTAKAEGFLDCLQLIHFHLGSQVGRIGCIKNALREVRRFYVELRKLDCPIDFIDVGGGLGVNYGEQANASVNYTIQEYANDVVYYIYEACEEENLPHPHLISESGRALTAHHSVMIFNILDATHSVSWNEEESLEGEKDPTILDLHEILHDVNQDNLMESWHDALELREQSLMKFNLGLMDLKGKAQVERMFWQIAKSCCDHAQQLDPCPAELNEIRKKLADKYFCNFSIFQSLPDSWAIDHLFPITPIHRLNEEPTKEVVLQDITCDSDGKLDQFVLGQSVSSVLPAHEFRLGEPYLFGAYLVGAYQEILGDLHNLFGDTHTVHVVLNQNGEWSYEQVVEGEDVSDVLKYVQYDADNLLQKVSRHIGVSQGQNGISPEEAEEFMRLYRQGLRGYTYLIEKSQQS